MVANSVKLSIQEKTECPIKYNTTRRSPNANRRTKLKMKNKERLSFPLAVAMISTESSMVRSSFSAVLFWRISFFDMITRTNFLVSSHFSSVLTFLSLCAIESTYITNICIKSNHIRSPTTYVTWICRTRYIINPPLISIFPLCFKNSHIWSTHTVRPSRKIDISFHVPILSR